MITFFYPNIFGML